MVRVLFLLACGLELAIAGAVPAFHPLLAVSDGACAGACDDLGCPDGWRAAATDAACTCGCVAVGNSTGSGEQSGSKGGGMVDSDASPKFYEANTPNASSIQF